MMTAWRLCLTLALVMVATFGSAQSDNGAITNTAVPRVLRFTAVARDASGNAVSGFARIVFAIYSSGEGGAPLWQDTQSVTADSAGKYSVLLGSTTPDGIPQDVFSSGEARWLGIQPEGQPEQARVLLVSVPYALKAADAETLGGKPLSAFVLANPAEASVSTNSTVGSKSIASRLSTSASAPAPKISCAFGSAGCTNPASTLNGIANQLAKFSGVPGELVNSAIAENNGSVVINGTTPVGNLTVNGVSAHQIAAVGPQGGNVISAFVQGTTKRASMFINTAGIGVFEAFQDGVGPINFAVNPAGGNVGIGTSAPGFPLTVQGAGAHKIAAIGPAGSNVISSFVAGTNQRASMFINTAGIGVFEAFNDGVGPMTFAVNPAGGNVGIGTSSPAFPLTVQGAGAHKIAAIGPAGSNVISSFVAGTNQRASMFINTAGIGVFEAFNDGVGPMTFAVNPAGGNVGVGTSSPAARFHSVESAGGVNSFSLSTPPPSAIRGEVTFPGGALAGVIGITSSPAGYGMIGENLATGTAALPNGQAAVAAGLYGVSVSSPNGTGVLGEALGASSGGTIGTVGVYGHSTSSTGTGIFGLADAASGDAVGVFGRSASAGGTGVWGEVTAGSGNNFGVYGKIGSGTGAAGVFDNTVTGNILIGRVGATPRNVFRVDTNGVVFATSLQGGADFAESVSVRDDRSAYQPGDLMAIDTTGVRRFALSDKPYSTLVAGIYSTKPGVLGTPHNIDDPRVNTEEIPLAIVGIVPCKVTNENGQISAGDLLVSSSIPGYAMKGTERNRMTGAVIGKALQSMSGKTGVIEVLVSLQ